MKTGKPKVVCLCGSTKFYKAFQKAYLNETLAGNIVLSLGVFRHSQKEAHGTNLTLTEDDLKQLEELNKRRIDMADEILIINVEGYIGEATTRELIYAKLHNKPIRWLEPRGGYNEDCD